MANVAHPLGQLLQVGNAFLEAAHIFKNVSGKLSIAIDYVEVTHDALAQAQHPTNTRRPMPKAHPLMSGFLGISLTLITAASAPTKAKNVRVVFICRPHDQERRQKHSPQSMARPTLDILPSR